MLEDDDLRIAVSAYAGIILQGIAPQWYGESDLFERLERLIQRVPGKKMLQPIVWDWMSIQANPEDISGQLVDLLGSRPPLRLVPYLKSMHSFARLKAAKLFQEHIQEAPEYREALFDLAGDRDSYIHENVIRLLEKVQPRPDEIAHLESLLSRKTGSLRRGVIRMLLSQPDAGLLASIDRLLEQKNDQQRLAGIELLREMAKAKREPEECLARVTRLRSSNLSEGEKHILADLSAENTVVYSLEDALGLADPKNLTRPIKPHSGTALFGIIKSVHLGSAAAAACIKALDDLVDQHRTELVEVQDWLSGMSPELIGNASDRLAGPDPDLSIEENRRSFQLAHVWERWWRERPGSQRDRDGFELLRAQAALSLISNQYLQSGVWAEVIPNHLRTFLDEPYDFHLKYRGVVTYILSWLAYLHPAPDSASFLLQAVERTCHRIGWQLVGHKDISNNAFTRISSNYLGYINLACQHRLLHGEEWTKDQQIHFWGLLKWLERFALQKGRIYRQNIVDVLLACQAGAASEDDLFLYLLGMPETFVKPNAPGEQYGFYIVQTMSAEIRMISGKRPHPLFEEFPFLKSVLDRCRDRIIDIELRRGDLPTAASAPALALRSVPGMENLFRLLLALGKLKFERNTFFTAKDRSSVLSHLIRISYPLDTDTPETFAHSARSARISEGRLIELALFAPQWAHFVEHALGWQGFSEGVWWVYAHTKDRQWSVDADIRESWTAQIAASTPLSADELLDGAVDVDWFHRMVAGLGEERWQAIYRVALYAGSGTGHARARLFADAMMGKLTAAELSERIATRRNQDAVRALGLVPLPAGSARQNDILSRFEGMQEFSHTSKQFGSQRQASEKLAAEIGMKNLARTAGYIDPQRLEWAMELQSVADLADGPIHVQAQDITATLSINDLGEAELAFRRGDRVLKSLPPATKKTGEIAALHSRKQALEQQTTRMRASLETAMVRGDSFSAGEIQALFKHPILRVMLEQLVFVGPSGMGYPIDHGLALENLNGRLPLKEEDPLRIAHPFDLLQSGCWQDWQRECFISERIQPFKQVFRELYLLTQTEQDEKNLSRRYAGHQVNPRQALALFGKRGWVYAQEEGVVRTFHSEGLVARVDFLNSFFTPAELEGATIEAVYFTRRNQYLPEKLEQIPPRLFSEVMRDLDLVVSVAHMGDVDPEASASSIDARATLIRETCNLLHLANVRVENHHALIDGKLGNYTIHLGSAIVHKQPGGALCIIPVHSQHRGRLFLPFVDQDPKTAEVVSKVLLLAKDYEIKDPTILEQILR